MSTREDYPAGAPCWVDTLRPHPRAALRFYGPLFGWTFDEATSMPTGLTGEYFAARTAGRLVAGIGLAPPSSPAVWSTYMRVEDIEQTLARAEDARGGRLAGPFQAGSAQTGGWRCSQMPLASHSASGRPGGAWAPSW